MQTQECVLSSALALKTMKGQDYALSAGQSTAQWLLKNLSNFQKSPYWKIGTYIIFFFIMKKIIIFLHHL